MMKVLASVGIIALVLALAGGVAALFMVHHGFSARDEPSRLEAVLARCIRAWGIPKRAKELKNPLPISEEVLAQGRAHFADHCFLCHANDGSGDTEVGRGLYPKSPDMRLSETQNLSDGELYYIVQNGIRLTGMPAWGKSGDEGDEGSWSLVAFIRHLPKLTTAELAEMDKLNPKGPGEREEEKQEEDFLKGNDAQPKAVNSD